MEDLVSIKTFVKQNEVILSLLNGLVFRNFFRVKKSNFLKDKFSLIKILKGARIPGNCVIGACSVVEKGDLKENSIIAGNPAKTVRTQIN